jgi:MFS family permease
LGWIADRFGSVALVNVLGVSVCIGISLLVLASWWQVYPLLFPGFILIGIMFNASCIMTVQTGLVFQGKSRRQVISFLNNLLDAGAVTYLILYEISQGLENTDTAFLWVIGGYLLAALLCCAGASFFWVAVTRDIEKQQSFLYNNNDNDDEKEMLHHNNLDPVNEEEEEKEEEEEDASLDLHLTEEEKQAFQSNTQKFVKPVDHTLSHAVPTDISLFENSKNTEPTKVSIEEYQLIAKRQPRDQLRSEHYVCVLLFFLCHDARTSFIASTARDFLASLGDNSHGNLYLSLFTYINVASILALPFTDRLLENYGYSVAFQIINIMAIINGIIQVASDNLNVQVLGFVIFSFYRSLTFSAIFSYMPVFLSGDVAGRGVGIMTLLAGIFGIINIPLASLTVGSLDGDFFYANLFYTVFVIPFIYIAARIGQGIQKEQDAASRETRESLQRLSSVHIKLSSRVSITAAPTNDEGRRLSQITVATKPRSPSVSTGTAEDLRGSSRLSSWMSRASSISRFRVSTPVSNPRNSESGLISC